MPIYEYACLDCGKVFEAIRSMRDADNDIPCTTCASLKTRRLVSVCVCHNDGKTRSVNSACSGCSGTHCNSCNH